MKRLTARRQEALVLLVLGRTQAEAAKEMGVTRKTVESQLALAKKRLGCRTTVQLAARFVVSEFMLQFAEDLTKPELKEGA